MREALQSASDRWIRVAQSFANQLFLVEDGFRHEFVEPVNRNDSFLPHGLLRVAQKLENQRRDGRDHLKVNEPADRSQGGTNL